MEEDTFIPLSFLDQILSADFQTFFEVKIDIKRVILTPYTARCVLVNLPLKMSIFLAFIRLDRQG